MSCCLTCRHWEKADAFVAQGLTFSSCRIRPSRLVSDERLGIGALVAQGYVTQDSYSCPKFEEEGK